MYRNAGFFNKVFNIWAGKYVRWVNKKKGIRDFTNVVKIEDADKTEIMFEKFYENMEILKQKWKRLAKSSVLFLPTYHF